MSRDRFRVTSRTFRMSREGFGCLEIGLGCL